MAEKLYWEEQYAKISKAGKDNHKIIPDLYLEYRFYKDKHAKLSFLSNNIIGDTPRSLRDAENVMIPVVPKNFPSLFSQDISHKNLQ